MNKCIVLVAIIAAAFAQTQLSSGNGETGTLLATERDDLYYINVPENFTYVAVTVTGVVPPSGSCSYVYLYASWLGFPCGDEPSSTGINTNGDPCYTSAESYVSASSTGTTNTFYFYPGQYTANTLLGSDILNPNGGTLYFSVNKYYTTDNCGYTLKATIADGCPSALNANNGIAVAGSYDSFSQQTTAPTVTTGTTSGDLTCAVYTNITLQNDVSVVAALNNVTGLTVFKTVLPKNVAYLNITLSGMVNTSSSFYLYFVPGGAITYADSSYACYNSFSGTGNDNNVVQETFTCYFTPEGPGYFIIESASSSQFFNGNLSVLQHVCADGTATGRLDAEATVCSAARYVNASSLLTTGVLNFTNVPSGETVKGYLDIPAAFAGASVTLNYTGSNPSGSGIVYVSTFMNSQTNGNEYSTSSQYNGVTLTGRYDLANVTMLLGKRLFIQYYCSASSGSTCSGQVATTGTVLPPTPTPPTPTPGPTPPTVTTSTGNSTIVTTSTGNFTVTGNMTTTSTTGTTTGTTAGTTGNGTTTGNRTTTSGNSTTTSRATTGSSASSGEVILPSLAIAFATLFAALL